MLTLESAAGLSERFVVCSMMYSFSLLDVRVGVRECVLSTSSIGERLRDGWRVGEGRVMVRTFVMAGDFSSKEVMLAVTVDYT